MKANPPEQLKFGSLEELMSVPGYWVNVLENIVTLAAQHGFVVTVATIPVPGTPLAMGNYGLAIDVRDSRTKYTGQLKLPEPARQFALHEIPPFSQEVQ